MKEYKDKWEQWLDTREGRACMDMSIVKPGQEEFAKNRLWWAFHAGNFPVDGLLETKAESLLRRVIEKPGTYVPQRLKREIELYLEQKAKDVHR